MRVRWLAVAVVGAVGLLGCESLRTAAPPANAVEALKTPSPGSLREPPSPRNRGEGHSPPSLREGGNTSPRFGERSEHLASRGVPGEGASPQFQPAAAAEPLADTDPLTLAAECLERGDSAAAAIHLEAYVRRHPEQLMFRAQLAEMLLRVGRDDDAKVHYERFAADAEAATGAPRTRLVDAHTRLMEIAQRADDRFAEVFHRGVGLLLLVQEQDRSPDRDADFCEEMLCKALRALAEAKELRPADPRVRVYLAEVYDRTGNPRGADAERAAAKGGFVPGLLTPTERKRLMPMPN
jgi:predicted Zn-dependent protease